MLSPAVLEMARGGLWSVAGDLGVLIALPLHLAKSWFFAQANRRVIPAAPTWVGGVHSHSTPEGAYPASHTTKALLPSSPGALLPHTSLSSGLTPIAPALTQSGRMTGLQPLPSSPGFCPHPVALRLVVAHVTRGPMETGPMESVPAFPHRPVLLPAFFPMSEHSSLQKKGSLLYLVLVFSQMCPFREALPAPAPH